MPARSASTSGAEGATARAAALYLRLAGVVPAPGEPAALRALSRDGDVATLRALARRDGTTAEVWRRLAAAEVALPADDAAALAREARVLDFHRLRLDAAIADVVRLLHSAGLRVALLKGAALARTVYTSPVRRPMADADLLLAPEDAATAAALLRDHGWTPADGHDAGAAAARYGAHHHLPPLRAPGGSLAVVELHHDVLPPGHPFAWRGAEVLARARRHPAAGEALVPACADLLLHACVHFAWAHELRHGAWRTFADVAALVGGDGGGGCPACGGARAACLAGFVERAEAARAGSAVAWTLRLAADVAGVRLPAELAPALRPARRQGALARHLAAALVPGAARVPSVRVERLLWERALRPGRSGHGPSRPWLVGAGSARGRPAASGAWRAVAQLRRLAAWRRYGRRLLGG